MFKIREKVWKISRSYCAIKETQVFSDFTKENFRETTC